MLEMSWVGTALTVALVTVTGGLAYLFLVRHRKQLQEKPIAQSSPSDEAYIEDVETSADGKTPPCKHITPPSIEAQKEAQTAEEKSTGHLTEHDLECATDKPTIPIEESQPPTGEGLFGSQPQEVEQLLTLLGAREDEVPIDGTGSKMANTADDEPRDADDLDHDVARKDIRSPVTTAAARMEPVPTQPVTEFAPNLQTSEVGDSSKQEVSAQGDLPDARRDVQVEKRDDTASATGTADQEKKPVGATALIPVPASRGGSAANGERKPDLAKKPPLASPRAKAPRHESRKAKPRKQNKLRRKPSQTRSEESEDDERLLDELLGITADNERLLDELLGITADNKPHLPLYPPPPSRYRPPSQEPIIAAQPSERRQPTRQARQQRFDLTVRLLFQRSGHFRLGLLPQRRANLPEEIALGLEGGGYTVAAVHEGWYEDVYPENLSTLLFNGITWEGRTESEVLGHWTLSGRDLYVLTTHDDLNGFAQATRLKIGKEHVILCRNSLLDLVEPILHQVGCTNFVKLEESHGSPTGWTVIRGEPSARRFIQGIVPTNVVSIENGPAILSIMKPVPDLEIDLQGGIYLQQATWLHGFPPRICVCGDMRPEIEIFIDGNRAMAEDDGSFTNQGYDTVGVHVISVPLANASKTYKITKGEEKWNPWDAHELACVQLCGPLLLGSDSSAVPRTVIVPGSNTVILGAKPGDIAFCPQIRGPKQVGCVKFHAVWAIPFDAFGCDKETSSIRLLSARQLVKEQHPKFARKEAMRVMAWCLAILNPSRRGLFVDKSDPAAPALWKEYKLHARTLWKMLKK